jgi:hypothetical protein
MDECHQCGHSILDGHGGAELEEKNAAELLCNPSPPRTDSLAPNPRVSAVQ